MPVWIDGSLDSWQFGFMAVWIHGSLDSWLFTKPRIPLQPVAFENQNASCALKLYTCKNVTPVEMSLLLKCHSCHMSVFIFCVYFLCICVYFLCLFSVC